MNASVRPIAVPAPARAAWLAVLFVVVLVLWSGLMFGIGRVTQHTAPAGTKGTPPASVAAAPAYECPHVPHVC